MAHLKFGILACALLIAGCASPQTDNSGRLLAMAAEEAAGIYSPLDRFARQLNIADTQIRTGRQADADKSLKLARETLTGSNDKVFDSFHRIAGWTAIAQLGTSASDHDLALAAADKALASLNEVTPLEERVQYVVSLSMVLADVRGKAATVQLLNSGAKWAGEIDQVPQRRVALTAIAYRLVSYEEFDAARTALRVDGDAAWRTDTFLAMANNTYYRGDTNGFAGGGRGGFGGAAAAPEAASMKSLSNQSQFGKDVRFESVFKQ